MDLRLDAAHDLDFVNNDFVLVDGVDAIAQDVDCRLKFFLGEWFLDTRLGVPYFQKILGEKPRLNVVRSIFRKVILDTPGIDDISQFIVDFTGTTRRLSISFQATGKTGSFTYNKDLLVP